jgi:hypothetical protein
MPNWSQVDVDLESAKECAGCREKGKSANHTYVSYLLPALQDAWGGGNRHSILNLNTEYENDVLIWGFNLSSLLLY